MLTPRQQETLIELMSRFEDILRKTRGKRASAPREGEGRAEALTAAQLRRIAPQLPESRAERMAPELARAMAQYGINTPRRQAAFLAQIAHESMGFTRLTEIASGDAYEGRSSLGNTQPGDGRRFKGRGFIHLTGRDNFARAGRVIGVNLVGQPELAANIRNAARIAGWYWKERGLNELADRGQFAEITKRINGGLKGQKSRETYLARARAAVGTAQA